MRAESFHERSETGRGGSYDGVGELDLGVDLGHGAFEGWVCGVEC